MTQSHAHSLIEAITNVAVGYMLAVVTQILVFPMFGWQPNLKANLSIALAFSFVSLARSYILRRLFDCLNQKRTSRSWSQYKAGSQSKNHEAVKDFKQG
jgi:hypothetical protein